MRIILVTLIVAAVTLGAGFPSPAVAYEPLMPKNGPTTRVIVIETSKSKAENISLSCLQGLVNRDSAEKIYVKGWPTRIFSHPELSEYANGGGMGDVYEIMLDLIPCPRERIKLPPGRYAALKWMLKRHQDKIKGLVLVSEHEDGSAAAGINACTFESLLDPSKQSATKSPGKELYINTRRGILPFTMARSIMNLLEHDDSIQRSIKYVNPRDFAATYRQWALDNKIPNDSRQVSLKGK